MRYYVEINGESSLDIQGLMIQSLPSISKPLMRSKQETIDGRDGDIITKLGYSAYDKTLKIGLWGNYDINEVIAFFNQEGTITFSNEPDKYYRFTILNRDDYVSQLDKFRTCTIALHCQPYKYKLNEEAEELENEYVEQEGTSLTFNNTLVAPMEIDLKGNTSQTGTPTPSSPIPVNNVSGDNTIKVFGKNLFDINGTFIGNLIKYNNGFQLIKNSTNRTLNYLPSSPISKGTYTLSYEIVSSTLSDINKLSIQFFNANNTNILSKTLSSTGSLNCILTEDVTKIYFFVSNSEATDTQITLDNIQLELGNRATTYEAYNGTTYNIDLPEGMELCKIGTYQDYIYKENDKWYLHKEIGKVVLNGSEEWIASGKAIFTRITNAHCLSNTNADVGDGSIDYVICDNFAINGLGDIYTYGLTGITLFYMVNNPSEIRLAFGMGDISVNDFKTWLTTHNTIVYYEYETPTNTEITYTPLINQLDAILEAQSRKGTTNITQVNNDLPFIITASVLSGTDSITLTNEGNTTSKPTLTITGSGVVGVYLENIQMFNISLGTNETIIIDTENMESYYGSQLKNRQVTGDYSNFALQSGTNNLKFTGLVTNVEITNYNRWI